MGHYVKSIRRTRIPSQHVVVHAVGRPTKNIPNAHRIWMGAAVSWRVEGGTCTRQSDIEFDDASAFWRWLDGRVNDDRRTVLWAYNAAYIAGLLGVCRQIDLGMYTIEQVCDADPPFFVRGRWGESRLDIWDIANWVQLPIEEIVKLSEVYEISPGTNTTEDESQRTHMAATLEALRATVVKVCEVVKANALGPMRPTIASQAMTYYRLQTGLRVGDRNRMYFTHWPRCKDAKQRVLPLVHAEDHVRDFERRAFAGGVVKGWVYGKLLRDVYVYDVNSLYPYIMQTTPCPARLLGARDGPDESGALYRPRGVGCVAAVLIDSRVRPFPVEIDKKRVYCTGRYWTVLCGPELDEAERLGVVLQYGVSYTYQLEYLFSQHAMACLIRRNDARIRKDYIEEHLWKMLCNTLWSKWAQRGDRWELCDGIDAERDWGRWAARDMDTGKTYCYRAYGGQVWRDLGMAHSHDSFPAVSAYCSSAARVHMQKVYDTVGWENLIYTCVDSVHTTKQGSKRLIDSGLVHQTQPGYLKLVRRVKVAMYHAPGWYEHDCTLTASGLPPDRQRTSPKTWRAQVRGGAKKLLDGDLLDVAAAWDEEYRVPDALDPRFGLNQAMGWFWDHFTVDSAREL